MGAVEIPLTPQAQKFTITLAETIYRMRVTYNDSEAGGWVLDIGANDGTLILAGLPLVAGTDLLAQHAHLQFGGKLVLTSDRGAGETPGYADLGLTSHLFFIPDA